MSGWFEKWKKREEPPKTTPPISAPTPAAAPSGPVEVSGPGGSPLGAQVEVAGPGGDPMQHEARVAVGGADGGPAKVELSGRVEVDVNVKKPEGGGTDADGVVLQDNTSENLYTTFRHQESALDEVRSYRMRVFDASLGRRTNIADVRRRYGREMDLSSRHKAYVNGQQVEDSYTPDTGAEVVWKEDSKNRG